MLVETVDDFRRLAAAASCPAAEARARHRPLPGHAGARPGRRRRASSPRSSAPWRSRTCAGATTTTCPSARATWTSRRCLDALEAHRLRRGWSASSFRAISHRADLPIPKASTGCKARLPAAQPSRPDPPECVTPCVSASQPPLLPRHLRHERLCRQPAARAGRRRPRRHHGLPVPRRRRPAPRVYGGGPPPPVPGVKVIGLESLGEQESATAARPISSATSRPWSKRSLAEHARQALRPAPCPVRLSRRAGPPCWSAGVSASPTSSRSRAATATGSAPAARPTSRPCWRC